jgi:hypothetical protein
MVCHLERKPEHIIDPVEDDNASLTTPAAKAIKKFTQSTFTFAKRANEKLDGSALLRQHLSTAPSAIAVTSPIAAILSSGRYTDDHG